jgi:hypothetical protein
MNRGRGCALLSRPICFASEISLLRQSFTKSCAAVQGHSARNLAVADVGAANTPEHQRDVGWPACTGGVQPLGFLWRATRQGGGRMEVSGIPFPGALVFSQSRRKDACRARCLGTSQKLSGQHS